MLLLLDRDGPTETDKYTIVMSEDIKIINITIINEIICYYY